MELIDVVKKLTGPIEPVGETDTDDIRYENLKARIELMKVLHKEVDVIADIHAGAPEYSRKRAGNAAEQYMEWLVCELGVEDSY